MSLDGLLTLAGLLVAIYTIVPRAQRLDLKLRLGTLDWSVLIGTFSVVIYLQFYAFFGLIGFAPHLGLWRWGITPQNASFLLLLGAAVLVVLHMRLASLSKKKIFTFRELSEELVRDERYAELISLLEKHLGWLIKIYQTDFCLPRVRERLIQSSWPIETKRDADTRKNYRLLMWLSDRVAPLTRQFGAVLPSYEKEKEAAEDTVRQVLLSRNFVRGMVRNRPYFALNILEVPIHECFDFFNIYISSLLDDPSSILYEEIRNNQNLSSGHRYRIPTSNKLLHYLFTDITVAERLAAWKPVGESVLLELDILGQDRANDSYNRILGDFDVSSKWQSKLFVAVRFFDIMVSEAFHQGIPYHMWLYYFPFFTEKIIRNYTLQNPLLDCYAEWPTRYSYLLYEMVSTLRHWIQGVSDIPTDSSLAILPSPDAPLESKNIPLSSCIALGQCLRFVLGSEAVDNRFKQYLLNIIFRLYFDLRKHNETLGYAVFLRTALRRGGPYEQQNDEAYRAYLITAFQRHDQIPYCRCHAEEFEDELR